MVVYWICSLFIVGGLGAIAGYWESFRSIKKDLKNPDSDIRMLLREHMESVLLKETELYAKGAEAYDDESQCLLRCGHQIASMYRDTAKRRAPETTP